MSKILSRLVLAFTLSLTLVGCSKPTENSASIDYLLPQLRHVPIHSLTVSSEEGETKMSRRDGKWWMDEPIDYLADQGVIESILRTFTDVEIGKKVSVIPSDLHKLELDEGDGIWIRVQYGDNKTVTFVVGQLNFPDDTSVSGLLGPGYSA